jgi:two-component sensor histidine kinase
MRLAMLIPIGGTVGLRLRAEPMMLPLQAATSLGLVTNAFKHAFPGERPGRIDVELRRTTGAVALTVADDGVGHVPDRPDQRRWPGPHAG